MLNKIIESSMYVASNSKSVKINENKILEFIESNKQISSANWLSNSPYDLLSLSIEDIVNFLLIYESICFSFWGNLKWTIETSKGKENGSMALLYALLNNIKARKTTDFSNISEEEFKDILKGNTEIPLFKERYDKVRNVSKIVNEKMNGNFYEYIKDITSDVELFNTIVTNFPTFKDERTYKGKTIYLYKLAQLLTSDILHIRELKEKIKSDYSHLVGCSDYKIPQVMRGLGILEYDEELSNIIDSKQEIEVNSEYEVEIRANMLVAIKYIKDRLNNNICAIDINDYIYGLAKNKDIMLRPYHLTRNVNY